MTYIQLKAGDIRQEGDEQRSLLGNNSFPCKGFLGLLKGYLTQDHLGKHEHESIKSCWNAVCLLNHKILSADLCHLEFRRPIQDENLPASKRNSNPT